MRVYSVNVDGEGDDHTTFFATRREAVGFERRHVNSGIDCGAVIAHDLDRAALVALLNEHLRSNDE